MKTWRYLLQLLRYRPWLYGLNMLGITAHLLLDMVPGLLMREYFNILTKAAPARMNMETLLALLVAVSFARFFSSFSLGLTNIPFMFEVGGLLRKNLLARILQRPGAQALSQPPGEAISRFRDDVNEITGSFMWFNDLIAFFVFTVIGLLVMLRINGFLTVAVFVPLIVVVVATNLMGQRITAYRKASRQAAGAVTGFLGESLGAVQAVQVAGAEASVVEQFRKLGETRRVTAVRDRLFNELMGSIFRNTISLGTGLILILAGRSLRAGTFTVGDFALFVYYLGYITEFTGMTGAFMAHYKQMGVSFNRMLELMQGGSPEELVRHGPVYMRGELPEVPAPHKAADDCLDTLELLGLSCRYPDSDRGIAGIDLQIHAAPLR